MPRWPGPHKYDPLAAYLAAQVADAVTLSLADMEALLGTALPGTASSTAFWGNYARSWPAAAWRSVGWRVEQRHRDPAVYAITFAREASAGTAVPPGPSPPTDAR